MCEVIGSMFGEERQDAQLVIRSLANGRARAGMSVQRTSGRRPAKRVRRKARCRRKGCA